MEQIENAVRCALDPSANQQIKKQAIDFCEEIKNSDNGWKECLTLFVSNPRRSQESRLFSLQVLENKIQKSFLLEIDPDLLLIKQDLMNYVSNVYSTELYNSEPSFIINKLSHCISILFLATFPNGWPSFFQDMLSLTAIDYNSTLDPSKETNPVAFLDSKFSAANLNLTDFFLRILLAIDEEMVNPIVPRGKSEIDRNTFVHNGGTTF
ncbi:Exportin-T [Smittium mucronatum]|uniref:Exportin-T n=1 Tax=Smittium mucronatum TaxID=133383 RepID=A0A1R0GZQ3_9FUNG|nr:Exportin-T [Smittium mucronatum]